MSDNLTTIVERLNKVFETLETQYTGICDDIKLNENVALNRIEDDLDDLSKKFDAARRGLGLVNKLSPSATKLKHTQRVMSNLSVLRSDVLNLERKVKEMLGKG